MKATTDRLMKMKGGQTIVVKFDRTDAYTKIDKGMFAGLFESHLYEGELYEPVQLAQQMGDVECEIVNNYGMNKEEKKMKKFELNGIEYGFNEESGRYSKTENGKTKRIGKAEYEEAASKPREKKMIPCESGDHAVELVKLGADYGVRLAGDKEFTLMDKSEFKSKVDKRDRNEGRFETMFEFMGRTYWTKDAVKKEVKKSSKKRTPKNVAYRNDDLGITMTEKQLDFCKHLPDTCFWELGLESAPWIDVLCDEIGGQFANKPMTIGAMVSTLREKGIINVSRDDSRQGKPKFLTLTDIGKKIFTELNIGC